MGPYNLGERMVRLGWAMDREGAYAKAQDAARSDRLGLWRDGPARPW
ncbi:MAG: hypothetical protein ACPGNT_04020 [Rhodospirillales bacterium]